MSNRKSCDRCYKKKEKCSFSKHAESCTQCEQSGAACTILRSRLRPGRRPKTQYFGTHDYVHVWDIEKRSNDTVAEVRASKVHTQIPMGDFGSEACSEFSASPKTEEDPHDSESVVVPYRPWAISSVNQHIPQVSLVDMFDLQQLDLNFFYATNDIFMLGPSFAPRMREALGKVIKFSPSYLQDSYKAIYTALIWARHRASSYEQVDITKGALSLQRLRTASVHGVQEAVAIASLGPTLAAFDALTTGVGSGLILRHALTLAKPWYPALLNAPGLDPITICPIFWDTVHCLAMRQIPVIQYTIRDVHTVDCVAGLCTTLMPLLYDICVISKEIEQSGLECLRDALLELQVKVSSWVPTFSPEDEAAFSVEESLQLRAQSAMYRTASLLLLHRIRNPIGTEDDLARLHADSIAFEALNYLSLVGQAKKLQHVVFPIMLAMLETPNISKEVWQSLKMLNGPSICRTKLFAVVDAAWEKRNEGFTGTVFELLQNGPSFAVIP